LVSEKLAQVIGVVGSIGQETRDRSCGVNQVSSHGDVVGIAGAQQKNPRPADFVGQPMELGGSPPSGTAYGLGEVPPFAPAAERWALMWVASMDAEP
jgi:hypothetical protein